MDPQQILTCCMIFLGLCAIGGMVSGLWPSDNNDYGPSAKWLEKNKDKDHPWNGPNSAIPHERHAPKGMQ